MRKLITQQPAAKLIVCAYAIRHVERFTELAMTDSRRYQQQENADESVDDFEHRRYITIELIVAALSATPAA